MRLRLFLLVAALPVFLGAQGRTRLSGSAEGFGPTNMEAQLRWIRLYAQPVNWYMTESAAESLAHRDDGLLGQVYLHKRPNVGDYYVFVRFYDGEIVGFALTDPATGQIRYGERDSTIGNEITNVTDTTLTRAGSGMLAAPYTVALNAYLFTWITSALRSAAVDSGLKIIGDGTWASPKRVQLNTAKATIWLDKWTFGDEWMLSPSASTAFAAGDAVVPTGKPLLRVLGEGGAVTLTSTPNVSDGQDGQVLVLQGDNDTSTLTIQDDNNLAGSGLGLHNNTNITLGKGDIVVLQYDAGDDKWYQCAPYSNN